MSYGLVTTGRILGGLVGGVGGGLQRGGQYGLAGTAVGAGTGAVVGLATPAETVTVPVGAVVGGGSGFVYGAGVGIVEGVPGGMDVGGQLGQRLSDWLFGADKQAQAAPSADTRPVCVPCGSTTMETRASPPERKEGQPPPNLAPEGATRDEALDKAKADHNIPLDQKPLSEPNRRGGKNVKGSENLIFEDRDGERVVIRHDYDGHQYPDDPGQDRGPHFNWDRPGTNQSDHYDYTGKVKPFGPLRR